MKRRRSRFLPKAARKWLNPTAAREAALLQYQLYCDLGLGEDRLIWRERQFQASLIHYIDTKHRHVGSLCFHVPLELLRRETHTAGMFHSLGARGGVADIVMLVPRGAYHGFVMELKIAPKRPTDAQCTFLAAARANGYAACWTDKFSTAIALIDAYLALPERAALRELATPNLQELPDEFRRPRHQKHQAHRSDPPTAVSADDERAAHHGAAHHGFAG